MSNQEHFRKLENVFRSAPVNHVISDQGISIDLGRCEIVWIADAAYFHAGKSLHGSLYFKLLDDAAYFAAASLELNVFLLTKTFNMHLLRPVTGGIIKAIGEIAESSSGIICATSKLLSADNKILATGEGQFAKSKLMLSQIPEYTG